GLAAFTVFMAVVPAALILTIGYGEFTHISILIMTMASMFVLIYSTDSVGKTIFLQLAQGSMTTTLSVILNLVRTALGLSYTTLVVMLAVACPLVYWAALRLWAKPLRFIADNLHSDMKPMIAMPVITMAVVYFLPVYPAMTFANHPFYCTAMMLAVEGCFFLYIYSLYHSLLKISRLLKEETARKLLETELLSYQESIEQTRQTRHDLRHHNALLLEYLQSGHAEDAISYLCQSQEKLAADRLPRFAANPVADAVLRIYSRQAQAAGIAFTAHADLPATLPLSAPEVGALLSNLLENGVEACAKVAPGARSLAFCAQTEETGLRLEVRNSVAGVVQFENGFPISTKPGGGTGTKSIAGIVKSHGGMLRFKQEDGIFLTQILLPTLPGA
ncbi:MAG: ATP-binding protein, partial [Gemmiger sp.]|nr:ATP-binding protein [Gemmiger sp.]